MVILSRSCPRCRHYLAVVIAEPKGRRKSQSVTGRCVFCGYKIHWTLLAGYGNQSLKNSTRSKAEHVRSWKGFSAGGRFLERGLYPAKHSTGWHGTRATISFAKNPHLGVSNGLFLNPNGDLIRNRSTSNLDRLGEHDPQTRNPNKDQYSPRANHRYDLRANRTQEELIKLLLENRELRHKVNKQYGRL